MYNIMLPILFCLVHVVVHVVVFPLLSFVCIYVLHNPLMLLPFSFSSLSLSPSLPPSPFSPLSLSLPPSLSLSPSLSPSSDGQSRTGSFICIHAQQDRLKTENVIDIFHFIKYIRIQRSRMVTDLVRITATLPLVILLRITPLLLCTFTLCVNKLAFSFSLSVSILFYIVCAYVHPYTIGCKCLSITM